MQHTNHIYFVGIGGIGMSAIARYFIAHGKRVSGYDKTKTLLTETLEQEVIPKLQRNNENAIFLSHKSFKYNDKIYVFYNEDEDNYKKPIGAKPKTTSKFSDFVATMTTLDKDGNFERNALFSHTDTGSILIPDDIKKITDTKYFFITVQRKFLSSRSKFTFGTINVSPN